MKRSFEKLSLDIRDQIKIIVEDRTGSKIYRRIFLLTDTNKREMLEDAKSWLWNMGNYNGQASQLILRNNKLWIKELGLNNEAN